MKTKHLPLAALCGAAFSLVALSQSSAPAPSTAPPSTGLVRQSAGFDGELWSTRLSDPNLSDRLVQYEALVDLARQDPEARAALEAWTLGLDPELAWTATLALRELRAPTAPGLTDPSWTMGRMLPAPGGSSGLGFGSGDPFDELRRMEQHLDEMLRGIGGGLEPQGFQSLQIPHGSSQTPGLRAQSQGFQLEQGPNGVKVTVTEQVDGDEQVTTYEGESLEVLLEQHPELAPQLEGISIQTGPGLGGDVFQRFFGGGSANGSGGLLRGFDWHSAPDRGLQRVPAPSAPGTPRAPGSVNTERLGVYVESPEAQAEHGGLVVAEVVPGSLADVLRVQAGDVLLELDGLRLRSTADIKTALERRGAGDVVRLVVADFQGSERVLTWTPRP